MSTSYLFKFGSILPIVSLLVLTRSTVVLSEWSTLAYSTLRNLWVVKSAFGWFCNVMPQVVNNLFCFRSCVQNFKPNDVLHINSVDYL